MNGRRAKALRRAAVVIAKAAGVGDTTRVNSNARRIVDQKGGFLGMSYTVENRGFRRLYQLLKRGLGIRAAVEAARAA